MKRRLLLSIALVYSFFAFAKEASALDPVVVEITDATMSQVHYHQINFSVPTKLVFTNLTSVEGYVYFHQNVNLVEVDFPALAQTGNYVYFLGNTNLTKINLPALHTVSNYLYVADNTALTELNVCALTTITQHDDWSTPYYYFGGNNAAVGNAASCFSLGAPANLALSNAIVSENTASGTVVGTLSADTNYLSGTLTYTLYDMGDNDNSFFSISGNELKTASVFDYETGHEYNVTVRATNQLGEFIYENFTVAITNIVTENVTVIEITDATMTDVYYHQVSFPQPTKLVFTNLTSVAGYVYFHQNPNLVEVDFPALAQTGSYVYFHGNGSLETANLPVLHTVSNYLYVANNTALTQLDVCALDNIIQTDDYSNPYYYIHGNTPAVDDMASCFSLGAPENLTLSNAAVSENAASGTVVGTLSADTNYPSGTLTYSLSDYTNDNAFFTIVGNELRTDSTFDFEADPDYSITVRVTNQLGEYIEEPFVVTVTDIAVEEVVTVVISDATLNNVYYHQASFLQPTKLVFENLASVSGFVYFSGNVNLVEVDFPVLTQTGQYFYVNGNQSLGKINASALQTIHRYLYVASNNMLTELNVCDLAQILPDEDFEQAPYYYVQNNPLLDFDTTCLVNTTIEYTPVETIIIEPAPNTLIGNFSCDTTDPVTYYFVDENGDETTNDEFVIVGNGLYLAHDYTYYTEGDFIINIGAIRVDNGNGRVSSSDGLNEKLQMMVAVDISEALAIANPGTIDDAMVLYPNPANDFFEIQSPEIIQEVAMYDMIGRKIGESTLSGNRVNTAAFPNGTYLAVIKTADGITTKKVVVRR